MRSCPDSEQRPKSTVSSRATALQSQVVTRYPLGPWHIHVCLGLGGGCSEADNLTVLSTDNGDHVRPFRVALVTQTVLEGQIVQRIYGWSRFHDV